MNAKNRVSWCAEVGFWWNFVFPLESDESLAVLGGEDDVQVIGDVGVRHKCDGGVERVACRTYGARSEGRRLGEVSSAGWWRCRSASGVSAHAKCTGTVP